MSKATKFDLRRQNFDPFIGNSQEQAYKQQKATEMSKDMKRKF